MKQDGMGAAEAVTTKDEFVKQDGMGAAEAVTASYGPWRRYARVLLPLLMVFIAASVRLANLLPVHRGLQALQDYDEAVWTGTAQLFLQGYLPYRDFFATLPPMGIYLLAAVLRLVYVPWGSGLGLMATRYASVVYGSAVVGLAYLLGRKLAGPAAGLLAASLLALDGAVVLIDRLAMLEPALNLFSILAILAYIGLCEDSSTSMLGPSRWWAALSGLLAAAAALAKTPGMVVVLALVTVSLLRRRWHEALAVALGFALGWLVLSAYFLLRCPDEFLKQVYFFQSLRPPDGVVYRPSRLYEIWHSAASWLTVRTGLLGGLLLGVLTVWRSPLRCATGTLRSPTGTLRSPTGMLRRKTGPWLVVFVWAGYTLLLILANSSYYPQYYVQLAVPLCLLGGGLLGLRSGSEQRSDVSFLRLAKTAAPSAALRGRCAGPGAFVLLGVLAVGLVTGGIARQYGAMVQTLRETEMTYTEVASEIERHSSPETRVLVFEPNYTLLASRQPAGVQEGHFLLDSYGEMLYVNLGIRDRSFWELARGILTGSRDQLQSTFWARPAQEQVLAAFARADLVVVDGRARYQLEPRTLAEIQQGSAEVFAFGVASLRRKER